MLGDVFERAVSDESPTAPTRFTATLHHGAGGTSLRATVDGPRPEFSVVVDARAPPTDGAAAGDTPVLRVEVPVVSDADLDLAEQAAAAGWFVRDGMKLGFRPPLEEAMRTNRWDEFDAFMAAAMHTALEARDFLDGAFASGGRPRAVRSGRLVMEFIGAQADSVFRVAAYEDAGLLDDAGLLIIDREFPVGLRDAVADPARAVGKEPGRGPVVERFDPGEDPDDVNRRIKRVVDDGGSQGLARCNVVANTIERLQASAGSVELTTHRDYEYLRGRMQAGSLDAAAFEFGPDNTMSVTVPVADEDGEDRVGVLTGRDEPFPTYMEAVADTVIAAFLRAATSDIGQGASQTPRLLTVHSDNKGHEYREGPDFRAVFERRRLGARRRRA